MLKKHIQVLNERFLSRYGVDRILLLMAEYFALQGAKVTYGCSRYSEEAFKKQKPFVLPPFDGRIFQDVEKFANAEKVATDAMLANWVEDKPDLILIGGWPFFDLAARAPSFGVPSVFIDAGAVPHVGLSPPEQMIQQELRRIRAQTLPFISRILPISDFIRYSQTEPDRLCSTGVRTIYLGADHFRSTTSQPASSLLQRLTALKQSGTKLLLAAGRFEPSGYKNSMAAIHVARGIRISLENIRVLVLHPADHMAVPADMKDCVEGIGFPSDNELLDIIRLVDLTLSTSLWEGFNLPLVESQLEGCPTLAFACGSHPEVVADPWFLCQSEAEMASKALQVLTGKAPHASLRNLNERFASRFLWTTTLREIWSEIISVLDEPASTTRGKRLLFVDVGPNFSFLLKEDARGAGGALNAHLLFHPLLEVIFVQWDEVRGCYVLSQEVSFGFISSPLSVIKEQLNSVSIDRMLMAASPRCCLPPLILVQMGSSRELMQKRIDWARSIGLTVVHTIFEEAAPRLHSGSVRQVSEIDYNLLPVDAIVCNSAETCEKVQSRIEQERQALSPRLLFADIRAATPIKRNAHIGQISGDFHILALEASGSSGGFDKLLDVYELLLDQLPHRKLSLSLVGSKGIQIMPRLQSTSTGIRAYANPSPAELDDLYSSANILICPSTDGSIELVGSKSLSMGLPCILQDKFLDLQGWGGCYGADMISSASIKRAILALLENEWLLDYLVKEAFASRIRDWTDYVDGVAATLYTL